MHESDQQQVQTRPWRIEQRQDTRTAQKGAQLRDVAQAIGVDTAWTPSRLLERVADCERRELPVQRSSCPSECAGADRIDEVSECQEHQRNQAQHDQRLNAAAGEHAVEYLHHVDGRHQQRDIQHQARECRERDERSQPSYEQPLHYVSPRLPTSERRAGCAGSVGTAARSA
jgi:hypothetical protein